MFPNIFNPGTLQLKSFLRIGSIVAVLCTWGLAACTVTHKVDAHQSYFKTITNDGFIKKMVSDSFEPKIMVGDDLAIDVSSLSASEDDFFNSAAAPASSAATKGGGRHYFVGKDGNIVYHKLGAVPVMGLTRKELSQKIQNLLVPYLKDAIVNVAFVNHKITVIGEVHSPQIIPLGDSKLTLLDALVLSGDISDKGRKDRIMVIRDQDSIRTIKYLNLENHSVFNSDYYYVRPNDVVYVMGDTERALKEDRKRRLQTTMSLVASGISLLIIVIDRIFK